MKIKPNIDISALKRHLEFIWAMTEREMKTRHKRAIFGLLWLVFGPFMQMFIIGFIFSFFIKIPNYYLFLLSGLLPWKFFSNSFSQATPSIIYERSLLQKAEFPIDAIPISKILSNFIRLIVSLILLSIFLAITGTLVFPRILLLIPALIWLLTFTVGISLFSAAVNVRYRDINHLIQSTLTLWFYATPILYSLALIPQKLYYIYALNPLTAIFELFHLSLLGQGQINKQIMGINMILTTSIVFIGIIVYRKYYQNFVDWL